LLAATIETAASLSYWREETSSREREELLGRVKCCDAGKWGLGWLEILSSAEHNRSTEQCRTQQKY